MLDDMARTMRHEDGVEADAAELLVFWSNASSLRPAEGLATARGKTVHALTWYCHW
jgi:hypothetical protein